MLVFILCPNFTGCMVHVFTNDAFQKPFSLTAPQLQVQKPRTSKLWKTTTKPLFLGKVHSYEWGLSCLRKKPSATLQKPSALQTSLPICAEAGSTNIHTETFYRNECNNSNHPITRTPPLFQENWLIIVFQAFEHPRLKLLFHYLNAYTFWNLNGGHQTSTTLWQSLRSYSEGYQMSSSILQAFSNIY